MAFRYEQTVVFDRGGWIQLRVDSSDAEPMSLDDLSFVVGLAERCALFERARWERKQHALKAAQDAARKRESRLCWPGFRPR